MAGVPPASWLQPTRLPLQLDGMIKDRPHRLGLIYVNQPLYFVTFRRATGNVFPRCIVLSLPLSNMVLARLRNLALRLGVT